MNITINNREIPLHFGMEFYKEINFRLGASVEVDGQMINTRQAGMAFLNGGLDTYDPSTVTEAIVSATATEHTRPSKADVAKYVEELLIQKTDEYKKLVDDMAEAIKKEPLIKAMTKLNG